jgi:hypothetical protein
MRVLLLTHPRSGGLSLMAWMGHELRYKTLHEPFSNVELIDDVFNFEDVVVKDFPNSIIRCGYDLEQVISKFDKVICHRRESIRDTAISMVRLTEAQQSHHTYKMSDNWLDDNRNQIEEKINEISEIYSILEELKFDGINTTYDGVYNTKEDIKKLTEYLGIKEPAWLDILDNKRRLRNGEIGMVKLRTTRLI